ncbi:classical arabinogalactan protein 9-like [Lathyrus oleraceus]|uniref:classical arabinogalactan protein 9-like n=1 Tax=Pisum sativum TaxID=3888 RepID=UPI0021D23DAE|nr:classical arabinogalactan protein 9-like [Pisum sativum]
MLNETTSPSSSTPSSPPYYILSSDNEPSDPQSPTLAQLQARALASQQPPQREPEVTSPPPEQHTNQPSEQPQTSLSEQPTTSPSEHQPSPPPEQTTPPPSDIPPLPISKDIIIPTQNPADTNPTPPSSPSSNPEPETAFPILEEAITLFAESLVEKIKDLVQKALKEGRVQFGERTKMQVDSDPLKVEEALYSEPLECRMVETTDGLMESLDKVSLVKSFEVLWLKLLMVLTKELKMD